MWIPHSNGHTNFSVQELVYVVVVLTSVESTVECKTVYLTDSFMYIYCIYSYHAIEQFDM
jgi:hypothetical protein